MIDLSIGQKIKRSQLHEQYGGRRQGGISPSRQSGNVFLFTDRAQGIQHGYIYDGPREDGLFHYTGEGQRGDQRMVQGNRAVRDHKAEGRELHLFDAHAGTATYIGRANYVDHYTADAPETGGGEIRSVIVFLLQLVASQPTSNPSPLDALDSTLKKEVPVEQHLTERMLIEPTRAPYEAERREQELVRALMGDLVARGHEICRLQLWPKGEPAPLYCDLYDRTTNTIIEAKGSISRPSFRMAIGQLADYARLVTPTPTKLILLPEKPRRDLLHLAASQSIGVTWRNEEGDFESIRPNGDPS
ncbi:MAG TPA: hypothetical protein VKH20_03295 [Solirubrobacterales bacterium]|nr:hypothetical protein [Solirubrobacterales bacterium]